MNIRSVPSVVSNLRIAVGNLHDRSPYTICPKESNGSIISSQTSARRRTKDAPKATDNRGPEVSRNRAMILVPEKFVGTYWSARFSQLRHRLPEFRHRVTRRKVLSEFIIRSEYLIGRGCSRRPCHQQGKLIIFIIPTAVRQKDNSRQGRIGCTHRPTRGGVSDLGLTRFS